MGNGAGSVRIGGDSDLSTGVIKGRPGAVDNRHATRSTHAVPVRQTYYTKILPSPYAHIQPLEIGQAIVEALVENPAPPNHSGLELIGRELDPNADLWKVYREETTHVDKTRSFEGWNKTLDVLLIFAGLFSAVVTAFVVVSYAQLQPDGINPAASAFESHISQVSTSTAPQSAPIMAQPPTPPHRRLVYWTTTLWFTSLYIALAVAFLSILAKQWVEVYHDRMAAPCKSPRDWASRRQRYFTGMRSWHMRGFITQLLPLLLHLALFLFLIGLSMFIWILDIFIAAWVTTLSLALAIFYATCTALPLRWEDCPTWTPLLQQIPRLLSVLLRLAFALPAPLVSHTKARFKRFSPPPDEEAAEQDAGHSSAIPTASSEPDNVEGELEKEHAVISQTVQWLLQESVSANATSVAMQALSGLSLDSTLVDHLKLAIDSTAISSLGRQSVPPTAIHIIRAIRSDLLLGHASWRRRRLGLSIPTSMLAVLEEAYYPDSMLLVAAAFETDRRTDSAGTKRAPQFRDVMNVNIATWLEADSPSISSTALLLLHCDGVPDITILLYLLLLVRVGNLTPRDYRQIFTICRSTSDSKCSLDTCDLSCVACIFARVENTRTSSSRTVEHSDGAVRRTGKGKSEPSTRHAGNGNLASPHASRSSPPASTEVDDAVDPVCEDDEGSGTESVEGHSHSVPSPPLPRPELAAPLVIMSIIAHIVTGSAAERKTSHHITHFLQFICNDVWLTPSVVERINIEALTSFILDSRILAPSSTDDAVLALHFLRTKLLHELRNQRRLIVYASDKVTGPLTTLFHRQVKPDSDQDKISLDSQIWTAVLDLVIDLFVEQARADMGRQPELRLPIWPLATTLAASICMLKRTIKAPVNDMCERFLPASWVCLDSGMPISSETYGHLAQHCAELDGRWTARLCNWKGDLTKPKPDWTSQVEAYLTRTGVCTACPGDHEWDFCVADPFVPTVIHVPC